MKKLALLLLVAAGTVSAATFNLFTPASGVLKGNPSTYVTTSATSTDVKSLWSGTCDSTSYLRGDGTCATPPGTGGGTVNSVALSAPSVFGISGSPVTTTGTLALSFASGQTANSFLATPDGTTGALSLRTILNGDLPTVNVAHGGTGVATITGPLKGNGTSAFSAATSADIYGLWSGTCSSGTFLRGDGACAAGSAGTVTSVALTVPSGFSVTGSPVTSSGTLAISGTLNPAAGGTGVATLTGIAKGNGTSAFTTAASGDVIAIWGGTCSASTYLRGDGSCQTPATGGTSANPSATIGLTAINGSAGTFLRSDGAPALSQAIAPTWTGTHIFNGSPTTGVSIAGVSIGQFSGAGRAREVFIDTTGAANGKAWDWITSSSGTHLSLNTRDDTILNGSTVLDFTRSSTAVTSIALGNTTDKPTVATYGNVTINAATSGTTLTVNATNASTAGIDLASGHLKIGGSAGTSGQVLTSGGSSAAPSWTSVASTASGTGTLIISSGCVAGNSANYSWSRSGNIVMLTITQGGGLTCTSNSSSVPFNLSGLDAAITPTNTHLIAAPFLIDNSAYVGGYAQVLTTNAIALYPWSGAFTASGAKGIPIRWTITYPLD